MKKVALFTMFVLFVFELVSAPIEWLWPASLGGNTHWSGPDRTNNSNEEKPEKRLALTFDDGPSMYTTQVLDILKEHNARATFFVMGQEVERYPEILKRMNIEGHELGNHTYNHIAQKNIFFSDMDLNDIKLNQDIIEQYSGQRPTLYRSPGGQAGRLLFYAIRKENLQVVNGFLPMPHPKDNAKVQLEVAKKSIVPGAIIILHDGDDHNPDSERPEATVELLPELLAEIRAKGFRVVTVTDLLTN